MSLESWKEEFYPRELHPRMQGWPDADLLRSELRLWDGLRRENLKKHDVYKEAGIDAITDPEDYQQFICADCRPLCEKFNSPICKGCPLFNIANVTCYSALHGSPYKMWAIYNNPEPMIALIKSAMEVTK